MRTSFNSLTGIWLSAGFLVVFGTFTKGMKILSVPLD